MENMSDADGSLTASEVARYLIQSLREQCPEAGGVEPMKLQALLYYCQAYMLAMAGKPIFSDPIEAWECGPVVESVYREYEKYNGGKIPYDILGK